MSLAFADGISLLQGWHYGSRAERLARLGYELDFQGLRLDVLSTIREEIRDQVFVIVSSLDNLMVVATLMLSLGFGFVVEGTFPPQESENLKDWTITAIGFSIDPLVVYAILCAMSLICPFWSLILTIRMRYEVDLIIREHMSDLKKQLSKMLYSKEAPPSHMLCAGTKSTCGVEREERIRVRSAFGALCPKRLKRAVAACPQRRQEDLEAAADAFANTVVQHIGPFNLNKESKWVEQEVILKWADKDLLQRTKTYRCYVKVAHFLLWIGMLSAIFTCALLLGMYMQVNFPHTPLVWVTYSSIVGVNGGLAILFALWMWLSGAAANPAGDSSPRSSASFMSEKSFGALILPLLESGGPGAQPWLSRSHSSGRSPASLLWLRVREANSDLNSFRQVRFPSAFDGESLAPLPDFTKLESLICTKFQNKHNKQASCVKSLVRLCDRLEIADSEDVTLLQDGDELEVAFTFS